MEHGEKARKAGKARKARKGRAEDRGKVSLRYQVSRLCSVELRRGKQVSGVRENKYRS